jgi:L-fuconolactonase
MKIDSHQHFWKFAAEEFAWINDNMSVLRRDFLPPDLEKELQSIGFNGSIAVQARQSLEETRWLLELADDNAFIKGVVGWVDLRSSDVEQQLSEFSKNKKFVGVRHILQDEADDTFMIQPAFINGLQWLQKYDLTYDILIYPKHLSVAIKLVEQFSKMRFVLDHLAKPFIKKKIISPWKEEVAELAKFPNVFCKVSGMVTEADWQNWKHEDFIPYLDIVFEAFGVKRILIGSDWPVCTVGGNYQKVMSIVIGYIEKLSDEEKAAILGGNAVKAYNLTRTSQNQTIATDFADYTD